MCSACTTHWPFPHHSFSISGLLYYTRYNITRLGQLVTLKWLLSVQVKGKVIHLLLEVKSRNDEAEWGRHFESWDRLKARPFASVSQVVNSKEKFLKQMIWKWNSLIADEEKVYRKIPIQGRMRGSGDKFELAVFSTGLRGKKAIFQT